MSKERDCKHYGTKDFQQCSEESLLEVIVDQQAKIGKLQYDNKLLKNELEEVLKERELKNEG